MPEPMEVEDYPHCLFCFRREFAWWEHAELKTGIGIILFFCSEYCKAAYAKRQL